MWTGAKRKWFFVFILPPVWAMFSLLQYRFPGDEYGMYAAGSIMGVWIYFLVPAGDVNNLLFPVSIAAVGAVVMTAAGWILDFLKASRILFWIFWGAAEPILFFLGIGSYPTLEKAISKNGSLWAYLFAASNLGLYAASILALLAALVRTLWKRVWGPPAPSVESTEAHL